MRIKCEWVRRGRRFYHPDTKALVEECKSINKAKKRSWELQGKGTQLGLGLVRVEEV